MKIVLAIYNFDSVGGTETVMRKELDILTEESGVEVVIITRSISDGNIDKRCRYIKGLKSNFTVHSEGSSKLFEIIKKEHPDVIHFHAVTVFGDTLRIEKIFHKYVSVVSVHSNYLTCPKPSQDRLIKNNDVCKKKMSLRCIFARYIYGCYGVGIGNRIKRYISVIKNRSILINVSQLIVTNKYMKNELSKIGYSIKNISIVSPSIRIEKEINKNKKQENEMPVVLFVGSIIPIKGVQYLLKASKVIKKRHRINIVGDGPYLQDLKNMASQLNINENIMFKGEVTIEINKMYESANIMVIPSLTETFGMVGLEAMINGLPVVAFDVGGVSSWCVDGVNGFLVPPKDIEILAEKIEYLISNPDVAEKMGEAGKKIAKERYSEEIHKEELLKAYNKAIVSFNKREYHE